MKRFLFFPILLLLTGSVNQTSGQIFFKNHGIPVFRGGSALPLAWEGGLNAPQFSACDLDFDGIPELVAFERSNAVFHAFRHSAGREYLPYLIPRGGFPKGLTGWVLMRDYDLDGKPDLFAYGGQGDVAVYRNTSEPVSGVRFELVVSTLKSFYALPGSSFSTNIYVNISDIPAITDLDGDGDLDILTFTFAGSTIEYHKNLSVENTGSPGLEFVLKNSCWGYFEESAEGNTVLLGVKSCDNQVENPEKSFKHTGSTLYTRDMDGDGIQEMILGDISFSSLLQINMKKSSTGGDSAVSQQAFPQGSPADIDIFPAAFQADVDHDGTADVIAAPNSTSSINNTTGVVLYLNRSAGVPLLEAEEEGFLQNRMIDEGENTFAQLFDVDGDNLPDLVTSGRGKSTGDGTYTAGLSFYRNSGSLQSPVYSLETDDLGGIRGQLPTSGFIPAFGNLDGDPASEVVIGDVQGKLYFFDMPQPATGTYTLVQGPLKDNTGTDIDVGDFAFPALWDIDGDGKTDLVTGERNGNFTYYRNTGSAATPVFEKITENFGGVNTQEVPNEPGYSTVSIFRRGEETYLLSGSRSGKIRLYQLNGSGPFTVVNNELGGIFEGQRVVPAVADLNGDDFWDLLAGNYGGGVSVYLQADPNSLPGFTTPGLKLFPNPAGDIVRVESSEALREFAILDLTGRVVLRGTDSGLIHTADLPRGVYIFTWMTRQNVTGRPVKLILQ